MDEVATQIMTVLRSAGTTGLLLDELIDRLGIDSETITTTLEKLESEGLILQKQELKNEQPLIKAQVDDDSDPSSLSDLHGCPCFHCLKISRCGLRQPDSPATCRELEEWMRMN